MSTKKLISVVLLVLVLITTLFGWTGMKKDYRKEMTEMFKSEDGLEEAAEELADLFDVDLTSDAKKVTKKAKAMAKTLKDGLLSPYEISKILGTVKYIAKQTVKMAKDMDDAFGGLVESEIKAMKKSVRGLGFAAFIYNLMLIIFVVSAILAIYKKVIGKKGFSIVVIIFNIIFLIAFLIFSLALKSAGFAITAWPFLSLIFAIVSAIIGRGNAEPALEGASAEGAAPAAPSIKMPNFEGALGSAKEGPGKLKTAVADKIPASNGWTCPSCGNKCDGAFCTKCGTKKPEEKFCPNCGEKVTGAFCTKCGTKI